tara:strand:+ start:6784 stop:8688 length:1905 start_codon:yes stop_codon:yes gene_type:complete
MTTPRVIQKDEISLNGVFHNLRRPVKSVTVPPYPVGRDTGDIGGGAIPGARVRRIRWDSAQGGIGKKDHGTDQDVFRIFYGTSHLRQDGHMTLPDRVTTTAASGVSGVFEIGAMAELASEIYVAFATSIRKYTFTTDSWAEVDTIDSGATDALTGRFGGTVYMIFTTGNNYYHTTDGSSWTTATDDVKYIAEWDDRLWGIDNTGQLRWAFDPTGTWTDDAQLPLESGNVQDLFVARDAAGEHILYASTKQGLFAHDTANNRFVATELDLPFHDDSGAGAVRWRDASYIPAGLSVYEYRVGGDQATIRVMGPDRDSGLPAGRRGKIVRLEKTHNDLVAIVDSTSATAEFFASYATGGLRSRARAFNVDTGVSLVLGWNGVGWQVLHETAAATEAITTSLVSGAYSGYRFWFAHNRRVKHFSLPIDVVNPSEISDREYADASQDDRPWFNAGRSDVDKIAVRINVEVADSSSTETVIPSFGLNYDDDTLTTLSTIVTDGVSTYHLPDTTAGSATRTSVGTAFRSIRIRTDMANGTNNNLSPDIRAVELEYREKLIAGQRREWDLDLDLTRSSHGETPKQLRAAIETALTSNLLVEFTYRDDDGDTRNYTVDVANREEDEVSGLDETGVARLRLAQV